jgi:hypothetical protein
MRSRIDSVIVAAESDNTAFTRNNYLHDKDIMRAHHFLILSPTATIFIHVISPRTSQTAVSHSHYILAFVFALKPLRRCRLLYHTHVPSCAESVEDEPGVFWSSRSGVRLCAHVCRGRRPLSAQARMRFLPFAQLDHLIRMLLTELVRLRGRPGCAPICGSRAAPVCPWP